MSFYTRFEWFKKLRLFSNVWNLKIDVVLKASRAVVIRWFSLNEAPLGLFKFISDYLPYVEKINIFFNIIKKKIELIYKDWSKLFVWFIRNNLNQVYTPLCNLLHGLHGVYNLIQFLALGWDKKRCGDVYVKRLMRSQSSPVDN
jgi:hypothetical protein